MPGKYKENELAQVPDLGEAVHKKPADIPVGGYAETGLTTLVAMQLDRLGYRYGSIPDGQWVENLTGEGKLLDGNGNPVPQSLKRSKAERDQLIGGTLLNGGSLYVYGSDELYPREMRINAETGKLEISDPISKAPEEPSNPFADKEFLRRKRVFDQTHSKKQEDKIIRGSEYLQQKQEEREKALAHNKEVKRRQIQAEAEQKAKAKAEPVKAAEPKKEAAEKDPEMLAKLFGVPKEKFTEDKKQEPEVKAEGVKEADKKEGVIPGEAKKEEPKPVEPKKDPKGPENLAKLFGVPKEKFTGDKKQEPAVKAEDKKPESISGKEKKEEPKEVQPKQEEPKKEELKVPADLLDKSKEKDAADQKQESDEKKDDKKAESSFKPSANPNPNEPKKDEPEKVDPAMTKKYFSKEKGKAAEDKPEDAQKKEPEASKEPKVVIVPKDEQKPEAKEKEPEAAEKKVPEEKAAKTEPPAKEAGLHFANTRRRQNRPIVVKAEKPTAEQRQDAEEDSRELLKGFAQLTGEKRRRAEAAMTDLTAKGIAAEEGLNHAISGNSGRPIDAKDALEDILVSDTLGKRLENGDEKALEILTDPAKLAAYRESLRETEFFKQNIAVPHTPEELRATYDGEKLKEAEDLLSAETDSVMEKKEAERAKAEAEKKAQEEKAKQEEIEKNTPAKITPLEDFYHGPKYEKPADKALDGTNRKALTDGMAATIWKDLGYQAEGKDLGDNRLLDYLAATGRLFDKDGKPIEGDIMRTNEKRENAFGKQLQNGESFFVYGKGELYPREIRFNKQTGCLECDNPLDHRPEKPGPGASKEEMKEYQRRAFAYEHFSGKAAMENAAEKAALFDEDLKKKLDERKAGIAKNEKLAAEGKFTAPKPAAPKKNGYDPNQPMPDTKAYETHPKDQKEMTDRFAEAVSRSMGYEDEFRAVGGGTAPLDTLMEQGAILAGDGSMIKVNPNGQGAWTPGHVNTSEENRAGFIGAKLQKGESFFVYRKGETYPREVKYDPQEKKIVVGEKIDKPPAQVPAPTTGQKFLGLFGRSKAVKNYEEYLKQQKLYEKFSSKEYQDARKKNDAYFKEQEAKAKHDQVKQRQQQKELDQTEAKKEYGPEFDKRVTERVDRIVDQYNKTHPDHPLNKDGYSNITTICRNYEAAQTDLSQGTLNGPDGSKTVQDVMAYKLMEKGVSEEGNAHLLWDANNTNYVGNMVELAKNGSDYKYMTGHHRDDMVGFCQKHLGDEKQLESHAANLYKEAKPVAEGVDKKWFEEQKKALEIGKQALGTAQEALKNPQSVKNVSVMVH